MHVYVYTHLGVCVCVRLSLSVSLSLCLSLSLFETYQFRLFKSLPFDWWIFDGEVIDPVLRQVIFPFVLKTFLFFSCFLFFSVPFFSFVLFSFFFVVRNATYKSPISHHVGLSVHPSVDSSNFAFFCIFELFEGRKVRIRVFHGC